MLLPTPSTLKKLNLETIRNYLPKYAAENSNQFFLNAGSKIACKIQKSNTEFSFYLPKLITLC